MLQQLSLFNLLFTFTELINRASVSIQWAFYDFNGTYAVLVGIANVLVLILTVFLPAFLAFNIALNKTLVYSDLYRMCQGPYLRDYIFTALATQLASCGVILCYATTQSLVEILSLTEPHPAGLTQGESQLGRAMIYPFFTAMVIGGLGILNGAFYRVVAGKYGRLEDSEMSLTTRVENIKDGTRALIAPGNSVRLVGLVDKPFLVEKRAVILSQPDPSGRLRVKAEGRYELTVEEFNLVPDTTPEQREENREFVGYRVAEALMEQQQMGTKVNVAEKGYVIFGQFVLGISVTFFLLHLTNAYYSGWALHASAGICLSSCRQRTLFALCFDPHVLASSVLYQLLEISIFRSDEMRRHALSSPPVRDPLNLLNPLPFADNAKPTSASYGPSARWRYAPLRAATATSPPSQASQTRSTSPRVTPPSQQATRSPAIPSLGSSSSL